MNFEFNYDAPPTVRKFLRSKARNIFIKGPIGSGKSVGACIKIFLIALNQAPCKDGVRRTRFVVVRNTSDQLKDTSLKTWQQWFPDGPMGKYKITDRTYVFNFTPPDGIPVHSEVMFRALDDPSDVAKVLSLELTAAWINECREVPKEIVENLGKRCGRYPSKADKPDDVPPDQWPTYHGIFGDTNAPEQDSYWQCVFEHEPVDEGDDGSILVCDTFSQPPGDSPEAENTENLPPDYYERGGRSEEWYRTMVQVQYARSLKGKPVYEKSFKPERHVVSKDKIKKFDHLPVIIGLDTARNPAAVFEQMGLDGRIRTLYETHELGMGAKSFIARKLKPLIAGYFPNNPLVFVMDPAGSRQNETDDDSWHKVMKASFKGHSVKFASTNDLKARINATDEVFRTWPDGEPMNEISDSCMWLIQGIRSKYRYQRVKGTDNRYSDSPEKNDWAHTVEAKQYADLFLTSKYYRPEDYTRAIHDPFKNTTTYRPADAYAGY
jgi:hypothetical protein